MFDLHRHDEYSTFDGFGKPAELAVIAKELGYKTLCTTNHGNTNNLVKVTLDRYEKDRYYDLGYKVIINECNDVIICNKELE